MPRKRTDKPPRHPDADQLESVHLVRCAKSERWSIVETRGGEQNGETFTGITSFDEAIDHLRRRYDEHGTWREAKS